MHQWRIWLTNQVQHIKTDRFYRHTLLFMSASLITSVLNYLYYPLMARLVGVEGYGELQIITSFLLQLTTVFVGLNLISVNIVANHDESEGKALMVALQKAVFWLIAFACVGVAALSGTLQQFFHFSSPWPFLLIIPSLLIDAIAVFWTGYLQGHRDFPSLSIYTIMTGLGKIAFSVLLVWLGFGVAGGILGVALGLTFSLIIVRIVTKHQLPPLRQTLSWPKKHEFTLIRGHLVYILEVIISLVVMSVLLSIDSILVKRLFSPEFAGQYAGVSTVARIIFFASAPIVSVMLPAITLRNLRHSQQAYRRTLALSALVSVGGLAVFSIFPSFLLTLLLGKQFAGAASWLPLLSVLAILVTLTNISINYLLALRSHLAIIVSLTSLAISIPLILWRHDTIAQIVSSAAISLLAGQCIFWVANLFKRGSLGQAEHPEKSHL